MKMWKKKEVWRGDGTIGGIRELGVGNEGPNGLGVYEMPFLVKAPACRAR